MRRKNWLGLLGILGLMLCLAGCDLDGGNVAYEVIYPSGYARDCYTGEKTAPVEGTEYTLSPADGDLQVLDGAGRIGVSCGERTRERGSSGFAARAGIPPTTAATGADTGAGG